MMSFDCARRFLLAIFVGVMSANEEMGAEWTRQWIKNDELTNWIQSYAFPEGLDRRTPTNRELRRSNAVFVVQNDRVVFEMYHRGFGPQVPHLTWSVTKSFLNTWVGILENQGRLHRKDRVQKIWPEFKDPSLTIEQLLHWESGLNWNEGYEFNPVHSKVIQMLFSIGAPDMARFVASQKFARSPGERHQYSSGDSVLLSGVLKRVLEKDYSEFLWRELFEPLGMKSVSIESDATGTLVMSSFLYASAEDLARWANLYLKGGEVSGRKILSREWIDWSTKVSPGFQEAGSHRRWNWIYPGAHFWVNRVDPQSGEGRVWKDLPDDFFMAKGHWGQAVAMIPSERVIIVRFGDDRGSNFDWNLFFGNILRGLKSQALRREDSP
jgi:CubicO group peptidase (beta-lactamase class C family)